MRSEFGMRVFRASLLLAWATTATARPALKSRGTPSCRFALQYNQSDILNDPTDFIMDLLYWEGRFHQNSVGYNTLNGMSYDGTQIDLTTGLATSQHNFSAASKEVSRSPQISRVEFCSLFSFFPPAVTPGDGLCPCDKWLARSCPVPFTIQPRGCARYSSFYLGDKIGYLPKVQRNLPGIRRLSSLVQ